MQAVFDPGRHAAGILWKYGGIPGGESPDREFPEKTAGRGEMGSGHGERAVMKRVVESTYCHRSHDGGTGGAVYHPVRRICPAGCAAAGQDVHERNSGEGKTGDHSVRSKKIMAA